ncbi:MAG: hypothetical protein GC131_01275 [Alphaproteobacteria bacterium]|nr:hypothetical protein [Alphaproteobacteria bacterium]
MNEQTQHNLSMSVERHLRHYFAMQAGQAAGSDLYDRVLHQIERPLLILTLERCKGNQIKAAALLGLNRNTLRKKLKMLGITPVKKGKS